MIGFIVSAIFVSAAVVVYLLLPLVKTSDSASFQRDAQNIHYAKERLDELAQQLDNETISSEDYEALKLEIESTLAADIDAEKPQIESAPSEPSQANGVVIALVCTLIPFGGLFFYQLNGTPQAIVARPAAPAELPAATTQDIDSLVVSLENRLKQQPDDAEGWTILARTYLSLGKYQQSIEANRKLLEVGGEDANVYAQMADAAALLAEGNLAGQPSEFVRKALQLNPQQPQALWLAGLSAAQLGQNDEARLHWNKLLPLLSGAPQQQQELREIIQQTLPPTVAQAEAAPSGAAPSGEASAQRPAAAQALPGIRVRVELAEEIKDQTLPNETVFVFARAQNGPAAPLAVKPLRVSDLPIEISLSDADGMIPQFKLSAFNDVVVSARIAKSGNPVAQPGDIQSALINTSNTNPELINLVISEVLQ